MVQRKRPQNETLLPPKLVEPTEEAKRKLEDRIAKGKALRDQPYHNRSELDEAKKERTRWSEFNAELLIRLFDNSSVATEYNNTQYFSASVLNSDYSFQEEVNDFRESVGRRITKLESILDRLDLIPELFPATSIAIDIQGQSVVSTNDVFIVHGQDDGAKETLARFISKINLNPIILHEQANEGRTIIDKFESHASSVGYAVVVMTPDDKGYNAKDNPEDAKSRARQNVIFELGYFIGKLSRKNVCTLYKQGVEIPSDYQGVLFVPMDDGGAWRFLVAKELKSAGYEIDMNLI